MAGTNNTNTQTTIIAEASASTTSALVRANRIAVQVTPTGFKADFYRTHKKLATLTSDESGWEADETLNKSALRENFRQFAIGHAEDIGILWNPQDMRSVENKRIPKYENDEMLMADAVAMLSGDAYELVAKCPHGVSYVMLEAEAITPVTHSAKGTDLTKLGVIDGKYERSQNWAWADVEMLLTLTKGGKEIYYTTKVQLVSGQLKKPHITQTSFNEAIKVSLQEAGLWQEEAKEGQEKATETTEEATEGKDTATASKAKEGKGKGKKSTK